MTRRGQEASWKNDDANVVDKIKKVNKWRSNKSSLIISTKARSIKRRFLPIVTRSKGNGKVGS